AHSEDDQGRALEMLIRALQVADGDIRWPVVRLTDAFTAMLQRHPSVAAQWPVPLGQSDAVPEGWPRRDRAASPPVVLTDRGRAGWARWRLPDVEEETVTTRGAGREGLCRRSHGCEAPRQVPRLRPGAGATPLPAGAPGSGFGKGLGVDPV